MPVAVSFAVDCEGWHPANVRRVRAAVSLSMRNESIRAAYRERPDDEKGTDCIARLAAEHTMDYHAVEAVIWPRNPSP